MVATPLSRTATPTPAPVRAAVGRRGDLVQADREVGDVERAGVVEPEHRVVGDDHARRSPRRRARRSRPRSDTRRRRRTRRASVVSTPAGHGVGYDRGRAGLGVDDDRDRLVVRRWRRARSSRSSSILSASLPSSAASAVAGKARRQSSATARIRYLARIFIASTPVLLGPADLLKAGGRLPLSVSRGGTSERRSSLRSRSATAIRFGNRAILTISRPLALRPCLTTGLPLSFEVGIGVSRAKVEHFLDRLAEEVSPAWQRPRRRPSHARAGASEPARRSDRPRRCGATRRGRSASQPGSWRRSADNVRRHLYNDGERRTFRADGCLLRPSRARPVRYRRRR